MLSSRQPRSRVVRVYLLIGAIACGAFVFAACGEASSSGSPVDGEQGQGATPPSFGGVVAAGADGEQSAGPVFGADAGSGGSTGPGRGPDRNLEPLPCSTDADCDATRPYCHEGKCVECIDDSHCLGDADRCSSSTHVCLECLVDQDCAADETCTNGGCVSDACTPGETACNGANLTTCRADGLGWEPSQCPSGLCADGACVECDPLCPADLVCWQGECLTCKPFSLRCNGNVVEECTGEGQWQLKYDCAAQGIVCFEPGYCASACGGDPKFNNSNSGCDYWAVDLDNHYDAQDSPYAVIVSNLSETPSTVTITKQDGLDFPTETVAEKVVAPGALEIFALPDRQPEGAKLGWFGYRIQSTNQIIAYQFNPLDNVEVFSNDASLLLPVNTYGKNYRVFSMPELLGGGPPLNPGENCGLVCGQYPGGICVDDGAGGQACSIPYRGTMTILASQAETVVNITPSTPTLAGNGVPAMTPGETYTFQLEPYQVLNLKTDSDGGDLTGTLISATKPIGVFGGHEASVTSDRCCADHLEQQMFPVTTWGSTYVATKAYPRGVEADYWRVMAAEDGTTVTFSIPGQAPQVLNAGEWTQVVTDQDFVVSADKPVGVAQVLPSSQEAVSVTYGTPCASAGDCHSGYDCIPISEPGGWGEPCLTGSDCLVGYSCDIWNGVCLSSACSTQGSTAQCIEGQVCSCIDVVVNIGDSGCWCLPNICAPPSCEENGSNVGCPAGHTCACFDENCYCAPTGDPALILHAAAEQYRNEYVFLTPDKYVEDYVNIVAPGDATVTLDNVPVGAGYFSAITGSTYKVARLKVGDGVHRISADQPVGVVVYGFDRDVSYGYVAGLNLQKLSSE